MSSVYWSKPGPQTASNGYRTRRFSARERRVFLFFLQVHILQPESGKAEPLRTLEAGSEALDGKGFSSGVVKADGPGNCRPFWVARDDDAPERPGERRETARQVSFSPCFFWCVFLGGVRRCVLFLRPSKGGRLRREERDMEWAELSTSHRFSGSIWWVEPL